MWGKNPPALEKFSLIRGFWDKKPSALKKCSISDNCYTLPKICLDQDEIVLPSSPSQIYSQLLHNQEFQNLGGFKTQWFNYTLCSQVFMILPGGGLRIQVISYIQRKVLMVKETDFGI